MTDWVLQQASGVKRPEGWSQRGRVAESDQPFPAEHYDRLRWYGNVLIQAAQLIVFAVVFGVIFLRERLSLMRLASIATTLVGATLLKLSR